MPPSSEKEGFPTLNSLSNLPSDIIANILGRLPIRDAIQTCILSRQWRYKWCSMTRLYFDDDCVTLPDDADDSLFDDEFARFIDRALLHLHGPVQEFTIATVAAPHISDLNRWIYFASRNNVRKLSLQFKGRGIGRGIGRGDVAAPSSLFQCSMLTSLSLSSCKIRELPVGFDGFMSLKTLHFNDMEIQSGSLEKLILCCPILESLECHRIRLKVFRINAPLLKYLCLRGDVDGLFLEKTPLLRELLVKPKDSHNDVVIKFLDNVPSLEKLIGYDFFMKHWSRGEDPATCANITHDHLQCIYLHLDLEVPTEVLHLLKLMDHSPFLRDIRITPRRPAKRSEATLGPEFWSRVHDAGCKLLQLKKVIMVSYGSTNETEFMKLLLLNAPVLEEMLVTLRCAPEEHKKKVVAELLRCRRASREAEVVCSGF